MSYLPPNSPLFTPLQLAPVNSTASGEHNLIPTLPEKPTASTGSVQLYIIPTEKTLFFQGFGQAEYAERQPVLLRGCLFMRVLKPTKIKSISLSFKGKLRTDWPEGIPPKKNVFFEENDIISHTWPFYSMSNPMNSVNGGADLFSELPKTIDRDISHLNLNDSGARAHSPSVGTLEAQTGSFLRSLSPSNGLMKRANTSPMLNPVDSFNDLATVNTGDSEVGKPGTFPPGDYIYNFEHPLRPSLPETTSVTFGDVSYELEATVIRAGAFKLNLVGKLPITLVRTPSEYNLEENEPIVITRDWEDQLRYDIVIGGKSIVLDSYLPLAFRFVPLWGKVALHRIRVYLSENLEYYCQNKKVHRMEPSKKYLLLEHKAKKGKSLLAKKENGEYGDENDELLPRELEFQLYVPQKLNGRVYHILHPDTSFDEIQAHHWIKLCLRISKLDPSNEGKRKHYEILIDSPIHVLSPLAAHGNTLLPAYDDHLPESSFLPEYTPGSPPLSPDVTPIDNTQTIGKLFSALTSVNSNSSHKKEEPEEDPAQFAPERFYHLNSLKDNDEPLEREADMHLDANVYKPNPSGSRSQLNSPQAVPHIGSLSPVGSPMLRPIHLLRRPSFNPPPFNAETPPPSAEDPPPAYEEEDSDKSLSAAPSVTSFLNRSRSKTGSSNNSATHTQNQVFMSNSNSVNSSTEISIKDLLSNSLGGLNGHRNSVVSKKSQSSADSEKTKDSKKLKNSLDESRRPPTFDISTPDTTTPDNGTILTNNDTSSSIRQQENLASGTAAPAKDPESEEDIVNLIGSPELIPEAVSPRKNLSPMVSPNKGMSPRDSPILEPSPERPTEPSLILNENFALEHLHDEDNGYQSSIESSSSRRDSFTSNVSNDLIMGQKIPLLNLSTQSLLASNPPNTRTASVGSILFDNGRRLSSNARASIVDFVDGGDLGGDYVKQNAFQFKTPRRNKQPQPIKLDEEAIESIEDLSTQVPMSLNQNQRTLSNSNSNSNFNSTSEESALTINESNLQTNVNKTMNENNNVPGLKYGFMIE